MPRRYALFALVGIAGEDGLEAPDILTEPSPALSRVRRRGRSVSYSMFVSGRMSSNIIWRMVSKPSRLSRGRRQAGYETPSDQPVPSVTLRIASR